MSSYCIIIKTPFSNSKLTQMFKAFENNCDFATFQKLNSVFCRKVPSSTKIGVEQLGKVKKKHLLHLSCIGACNLCRRLILILAKYFIIRQVL